MCVDFGYRFELPEDEIEEVEDDELIDVTEELALIPVAVDA